MLRGEGKGVKRGGSWGKRGGKEGVSRKNVGMEKELSGGKNHQKIH